MGSVGKSRQVETTQNSLMSTAQTVSSTLSTNTVDTYSINDDYYTTLITSTQPQAVSDFLDAKEDIGSVEYYRLANAAVDAFKEDMKKFPPSWHIASSDDKYTEDHKRFYNKYYPLFQKLKSFEDMSISGYGRNDFVKTKLYDLTQYIIYNFPHGWKNW